MPAHRVDEESCMPHVEVRFEVDGWEPDPAPVELGRGFGVESGLTFGGA